MMPILSEITNAFVLPEFKWVLEILEKSEYSYLLWVLFVLFGLFASLQMKNTNERLDPFHETTVSAVISGLLAVWAILSLSGVSVFLYWNF